MNKAKVRTSAALLPPPGEEVVVECLGEIERLEWELSKALGSACVLTGSLEDTQKKLGVIEADLETFAKELVAARAENGHLKERLQSARNELMERDEEEESICPEDGGFLKLHAALEKQLAAAQAENERLREERNESQIVAAYIASNYARDNGLDPFDVLDEAKDSCREAAECAALAAGKG